MLTKTCNILILIVFVSVNSRFVQADDLRSIKPEYPVVEEKKLLLDPKLCQYMVAYQQPKGVEYTPNVGVTGKPVVPADINEQPQTNVEQAFSFNVTIDVAEYLHIDLPKETQTYLDVGKITFENGQVYFNDTLLGSDQEQILKDLCL